MIIAVISSADSADPSAGSGVPHGLASGLVACGVQVLRINVALPHKLDARVVRLPWARAEYARLSSWLARQRLGAAGTVDGVLQVGSSFEITTAVPTATYDDMTSIQHDRFGSEWFTRQPRRVRDAWFARQRAVFANATVCTVMSEWAAESVVNDFGVAWSKVAVVGAGVNYPFANAPARDWRTPRFLVVAQDWARKNVPQVVETFGAIRRDWPDATLDIVGPYPGPGPEGVVLHGRLNPASAVDRETMAALYSMATCFVMPSNFEPFGIAYADAGSAGIPSIGTTVGGAAELIGDGGVVVAPGDWKALREAMSSMCDPETACACGAIAVRRSAEFRWDRVARRIIDALGLAHMLD